MLKGDPLLSVVDVALVLGLWLVVLWLEEEEAVVVEMGVLLVREDTEMGVCDVDIVVELMVEVEEELAALEELVDAARLEAPPSGIGVGRPVAIACASVIVTGWP